MGKRLFDFLPFGRKRPNERPERTPVRRPREAAEPDPPDAAADFPGAEDPGAMPDPGRPAPAGPAAPSEPPAAAPQDGSGSELAAGVRSVRDSVDRLKQRALTVRQLREAIESTIESRVSELRGAVERIQELLKEHGRPSRSEGGAAERFMRDAVDRLGQVEHALAAGGASDEALARVNESLAALERRVEGLGQELPRAVEKLIEDAPAAIDKLRDELALRDARVLAWLERISVNAHAASRDAETAGAERAAIRAMLEEMQQRRIRTEALRKRLHGVREVLADGMAELREGVARNMFSRALLARRLEAALHPFERAIDELGELIRDIET
ncbi:MAG TPA: hypothetical protein DCM87_20670 [Planctomycetes bacterium]|nr:hypothetical protein [Planctomycetota bacterium]